MSEFEELIECCGEQAKNMGWWDDFPGDIHMVRTTGQLTSEQHNWITTKLFLVTSELVESHDEIRNGKGLFELYYDEKNKPQGFPTEIADAFIRLMDMCYNLNIPLIEFINLKLTYNASRGARHGGKVS